MIKFQKYKLPKDKLYLIPDSLMKNVINIKMKETKGNYIFCHKEIFSEIAKSTGKLYNLPKNYLEIIISELVNPYLKRSSVTSIC
jgi:hypothetical protein